MACFTLKTSFKSLQKQPLCFQILQSGPYGFYKLNKSNKTNPSPISLHDPWVHPSPVTNQPMSPPQGQLWPSVKVWSNTTKLPFFPRKPDMVSTPPPCTISTCTSPTLSFHITPPNIHSYHPPYTRCQTNWSNSNFPAKIEREQKWTNLHPSWWDLKWDPHWGIRMKKQGRRKAVS